MLATGAYVPVWEIPLDDTSYLVGLESVIKELASSQSIVIRGRGSQFILKDYPGTLQCSGSDTAGNKIAAG